MRILRAIFLAVLLATVLPAQAPPEPDASALLLKSESLRRPRVVELAAGGRMPLNATGLHYFTLQDLGLIRYVVEGIVVDVQLTPAGERASRGWRKFYTGNYGGSSMWFIPVATRVLIEARLVAADRVQFLWRWEPNEVGKALGLGTAPYKAEVRLVRAAAGTSIDEDELRNALKASELHDARRSAR